MWQIRIKPGSGIGAALTVLAAAVIACNVEYTPPTVSDGGSSGGAPPGVTETGRVIDVIDGDTIDVEIDGRVERVRYVGVNTPERDETCYREARAANQALVSGQIVSLVRDESDTDRYDRLLRYVYVGGTFVNAELVRGGWAEAVLYRPDDREWANFAAVERDAAAAGRGCHPTGIFNDGNDER
ncbi:MAG: thermonuclease family protein [bacterium]|nr:thermonuclease family protein [bacterium]